jgi:two-component system, response regulator YesN
MKFGISTYYLKLLAFSVLLGAVPVIILGIFSYSISSKSIEEKVILGNEMVLSQTFLSTEKELRMVDSMMNQLMYSRVVTHLLNNDIDENDFQEVGQIQREISFMQSYELGIEEVVLVNLQKKWLISGGVKYNGFTYYSNAEQFAPYHNVKQHINRHFLSDDTVRVVKRFPVNSPNPIALLLVDVSLADLNSILMNNNKLGNMYILDANRNVVAGTDLDEAHYANLQSVAADVARSGNGKGYFSTELNGSSVGVTYLQSEYNHWLYLSVVSLEEILKDSREIGRYTFYICAAIFILTVLFSLYNSSRIYSPIKSWYRELVGFVANTNQGSEIDMISYKLHSLLHSRQLMSDQLNQFFMMKLCQGELRTDDIDEKMADLGYPLEWQQYVVLVTEIDTLEETRYHHRDRDLLMFAINNMVSEIIPAHERLDSVVIKQAQVTVLGSQETDVHKFRQHVFQCATEIQKQISHYLKLRVSVGISKGHTNLHQTPKVYLEALEALKYRVRYEQEAVLFFDKVQPNDELPSIFPMQLEYELIDAIKLAERDEIKQKLSNFLHEILKNEVDHRNYHISLARLLADLLRLGQEIGSATPHKGAVSLFDHLFELKTVAEIENWYMQEIIDPLIEIIREQKEKQYRLISNEICEMINRDAETNLTLEKCAEELNYHPVYVSRIFRQEMGINFSEYLARVRLGIAKQWLLETDMTINEIAQRLHYSNSGNFIRYFKNIEGLAPGKYRESRR